MATGLTPNYNLPYPLSTDPVNVAGDIEQLADKIDLDLKEIIEDISSDMWTSGGTFSNGLQAPTYNDSTGKMSMSLSQDLQTSASPTFVNVTLTGDAAVNGGDITTTQTTFNLINTTATTLNIGEAATVINVGASAGQVNIRGNFNIADTKVYEINDVAVLSASALGSGIVSSSLTALGTITTGTWDASTIAVNRGGTGLTSYTIGDIVYASASTTLARLAGVATGNALISGGVGTAPSWGKIDLTTHVSGTLPVANGGTGLTALGTGIATWLATPSSANLAAAVTDETGTGSLVFANSPALTGTPTSASAAVDTNTNQIATTAFVVGQAGSASPIMNGIATVGTSLRYARQDHIHPSDTSRAPVASPTFTGIVSSEGSQIIMESATTGSPVDNVSFTVERGTSPNVDIRWNETTDAWEFTNDGTTYQSIGSGGGGGVDASQVLSAALFVAGM